MGLALLRPEKKGRPETTHISFRRGCLKGLIVVRRNISLCKL
ncbi:MAG: hypothetical protein JWO15_590 [Sphingomonadales bacterium]|nr:hypothetical protein [Sphingomonadales bacterium]